MIMGEGILDISNDFFSLIKKALENMVPFRCGQLFGCDT